MKEDIYIKILKWAQSNPGFTWEELKNNFPKQEKFLHREITQRNNPLFEINKSGDIDRSKEYILSFEGRFKLLEYEELQEARQSSRRAMYIAIISIIMTLITLGSQIWYTRNFSEDVNVVNIVKTKETQE